MKADRERRHRRARATGAARPPFRYGAGGSSGKSGPLLQCPTAAPLRWKDDLRQPRISGFPALPWRRFRAPARPLSSRLVPYGVQLGLRLSAAALPISVFAIVAAITKILGRFAGRSHQPAPSADRRGPGHDVFLAGSELFCVARRTVRRCRSCGHRAGMRPADGGRDGCRQLRRGPFRPGDGLGLCADRRRCSCRRVIFAGSMFDQPGGYHAPFTVFRRAAGRRVASDHAGVAHPQPSSP